LEHRLPLLAGGDRDLPARQQTLPDTIARSYVLLNPAEQALFRRLVVFAGDCTFEAADTVTGGGGEETGPFSSVLDSIASLEEACAEALALTESIDVPEGREGRDES
jgi:predicted ATPase